MQFQNGGASLATHGGVFDDLAKGLGKQFLRPVVEMVLPPKEDDTVRQQRLGDEANVVRGHLRAELDTLHLSANVARERSNA